LEGKEGESKVMMLTREKEGMRRGVRHIYKSNDNKRCK